MATTVPTADADLLRRLQIRDREAWAELYATYQPRLRAFAYRLSGNVHDADDLVQETFVRAVPRLDKLDPETADVAAYLFTTLRNLFLKQVARTKRQQPVAEVPEPALPTPIEDDPERSALLLAQQDEVRVANARLQPRQRLVLALRELEDRSYAEIGELVGMKENAVAQLIFRARESLRVELRLEQVDPERLPEECRRFLPLLAAHLDGQLKGPRRAEALAHIESCDRCQAALSDMREASRRYRVVLLPLGADDARAAIEQRLASDGYWDSSVRRRVFHRRKLLAGVIAAVVAVLGGVAAVGVALSTGPGKHEAVTTTTAVVPTSPAEPVRASATTRRITRPRRHTVAPPLLPKVSISAEPVATTPAAVPKAVEPAELPEGPTVTVETTAKKPTAKKPTPTKPTPKAATTPVTKPTPSPATTSRTSTATKPRPDTVAPTVTITSAPGEATSTDSAQIGFTASEADVAFACKLDGAAYSTCGSPAALTGLAPGQHTFAVRATDKAGNIGEDAIATWTYAPPDTTPPVVTITAAPPSSTTETEANFVFAANEEGATFACALDGGPVAACTSPVSYTGLGVGSHSFSAQATDKAGNTGTAATYAWEIVPPLPDLYVSAFTKFTLTVTNRGQAAAGRSILTISSIGSFPVPALEPGQSATFSWSICRPGTYSAVVDRTDVVKESDEDNNSAALDNTCP